MIDANSLSPHQQKINELRQILPEAFAEGKIDWEKLRATLGEDVHINNERYVLNWAGKSEAFKTLQLPTSKTIVPLKKESLDFENTQNIFIEGENLEVLKVLQKSYFSKIKMIYIDPPYNTGSDSFIYPDKFAETKEEYEKRVGDKDTEGYMTKDGMFRKNSKENGQYHSNWLNMMYPRLFLAKNLLRKDGVIFISINDNEVHNLRLLMNEVFGEENFISCLIWHSKYTTSNDAKYTSNQHEYILFYAKSIDNFEIGLLDRTEKMNASYKNPDNDPKGAWKATPLHAKSGSSDNIYTINFSNGFQWTAPTGRYPRYSKERLQKIYEEGGLYFNKNGGIDKKTYLSEVKDGKTVGTLLSYKDVGSSHQANEELAKLLGKGIFDNPKHSVLLKNLIKVANANKNDLILDFFGGSGTIAHAVMQLNKEDGGRRKYICVQLPEKTDEKDEAYKAGYSTIAEIAKERIRRASKQIEKEIKEEQKDPTFDFEKEKDKPKLDLGFKVFRLEESNFKQWRQLKEYSEEALSEQIALFVDPIEEGAKSENIMYELMLKSGKDLNSSIEFKDQYYFIDKGDLVLLLDDISESVLEKVIAQQPQKVIALDRLFKGNDQLKTNTVLQMRDAGITFKTI